jgi:hypothetical protein
LTELYLPGESVAPIAGRLEQGLALYLRNGSDLGRVLGLALDVYLSADKGVRIREDGTDGSPEDPGETCLRMLVGRLLACPGLSDADEVDPRENPQIRRLFARFVERRFALPAPVASDGPNLFEALILSLAAHSILWRAEAEGQARLGPTAEQVSGALVLLLANPLAPPGSMATLRLREPRGALVTEPGSILAALTVAGTLKAVSWTSAFIGHAVAFGWHSASHAGEQLAERTRQRAEASARFSLPRLDTPSGAERARLNAAGVVVVLVHGLFSTDLRTFDGLLSMLVDEGPGGVLAHLSGSPVAAAPRLSEVACLRASLDAGLKVQPAAIFLEAPGTLDALYSNYGIAIVGYPHNTLSPIAFNAQRLVEHLEAHLGDGSNATLVFVCHSRGGLVARHALALLSKGNRMGKRRAELITFGTPHDGASIAESATGREAAAYLLGMASTHDAVSVLDVCAYLNEYRPSGMEDLAPGGHEAAYIDSLFALERETSPQYGRLLVGGYQAPGEAWSWRQRAAAAWLCWRSGQTEHDMVVELRSSLSRRVRRAVSAKVNADHFSYFDVSEQTCLSLRLAAARVFCQIDWTAVQRQKASAGAQVAGSIDIEEDGVWIDEVFIRYND